MSGMAGYIDYNEETGKPFMGLMVESDIARINIFLSNKENAVPMIKGLTTMLMDMAQELRKMPDKIVVAKGVPDAAFRKKV